MKRFSIYLVTFLIAVSLLMGMCACEKDISGDSKKVYLHGQMNGYTTLMFTHAVDEMIRDGQTRLEVFIMSPGGVVADCFGAVDVLNYAKSRGIKVICVARGMVASAAVPVFAVGDIRIAGPNTVFMLHKPDRTGTVNEDYLEMMDLHEKLYITILADNCQLTYEEIDKYCTEFTWFTAKEAKRWGLVDIIR